MATADSGLPTGGPHDPFSETYRQPREHVATQLELRDVAALGDDLVRKLGYGGRR
jgi:hypothetical protein